ncbi:hypothetical protein KJ611_00340 [Patescibacteria group bacterium]|nr:hypothetical protein [Patescibacteria group bacterium]MBU1705196.1 hypothetical protein [Patescibacteria group bacterium]
MKQYLPGPLPDNPRNLLRRAGYGEKPGFKGQISYTRRFTNAAFPQFHLYYALKGDGIELNLHLDQKKATYSQSAHAHSADYDGQLVEQEMARIGQYISTYVNPLSQPLKKEEKPGRTKKGFWGTIFG